jgi:PPOX class probable F420-dependent enzyme
MAPIPEAYRDLVDEPNIAHFVTLLPDGFPHSTPTWVDATDDHERVRVNTARGTRKERNLRADPKAGLSVVDPENPYRYLSLWGTAECTTDGAREHVDALAREYMGVERYPEDDERVLVTVTPERVVTREE